MTGSNVFLVASPAGGAHLGAIRVIINPYFLPLDQWAGDIAKIFRSLGLKVTVASNKPSQLPDGTPAREVEFSLVANDVPRTDLSLIVRKGDVLIYLSVQSPGTKMGEDATAILYSVEFEPNKDGPVKVPSDVEEFLDAYCSDLLSHDLAKFTIHYSDGYLNSGTRKAEVERFFRTFIGLVTLFEVGITELVPAGDQTYLAGFALTNPGLTTMVEPGIIKENGVRKRMLFEASIIKENGEWKWYGNQRNVEIRQCR